MGIQYLTFFSSAQVLIRLSAAKHMETNANVKPIPAPFGLDKHPLLFDPNLLFN